MLSKTKFHLHQEKYKIYTLRTLSPNTQAQYVFFFKGKATGVERFGFEWAQSSGLEVSNVLREGKRTLEFSRPA